MGNCCQPSENNIQLITSDNDIHKPINEQLNPGSGKNFLHTPSPSTTNSVINSNPELLQMENELFEYINALRENPKQFISLIEKYKNLISVDPIKGTYFIIINNSRIDLNQGQEYFIECQNFLKTASPQKGLLKDDNLKIPRPSQILTDEENDTYVNNYISKYILGEYNGTGINYSNINYIIDQNVSDILFVIILNLIGIGGDEQIQKNFILSDDYDRVGITVDKIDAENNIYCYYCVFGKAEVNQ